MSDPVALVLIGAVIVLETFVIAAITRGVLEDVAAGALDMRLATARAAFYGAALTPLAIVFPKEIVVDYGPERAPIFSVRLFSPDFAGIEGPVRWLALAVVVVAASGALFRLGRTFVAVAAGERLAHAARKTASRFRRLAYAETQGPMVVGLFDPVIVLPRAFAGVPAAEQARILRHEHAHLRRSDLRAALIQRLIEDVFWWNPFLPKIGRYLAELREMASDETAAGPGSGGRKRFARVIFRHASPRAGAGFGMHASGGGAERRIERLVMPRRGLSWPGLLLLCAAFALAFCATPRSPDAGITHTSIATS